MKNFFRGYTLLEILLVLVISVAVILSVIQIYKTVDDNTKINNATSQILAVYQAAAQSSQLNTSADNLIPQFVANGYLSNDFLGQNINPWSGNIIATVPDVNTLEVSLSDVPAKFCRRINAKLNKITNNPLLKSKCPALNAVGNAIVIFNLNINSDTK